MAINDYASLQSAVARWLARADLTSAIPDFISLAESRINRDLKVRQMVSSVGLTASAGVFNLPSDYISAIRLSASVSGIDSEIQPLTSAENLNARLGGLYGYVIEGSVGKLVGGSGIADLTLSYYGQIPTIETNNNWLITNYPDVYLYGTLIEAMPYIQDDARIGIWQMAYAEAINSLTRVDNEARFSPSPRIRAVVYAP